MSSPISSRWTYPHYEGGVVLGGRVGEVDDAVPGDGVGDLFIRLRAAGLRDHGQLHEHLLVLEAPEPSAVGTVHGDLSHGKHVLVNIY